MGFLKENAHCKEFSIYNDNVYVISDKGLIVFDGKENSSRLAVFSTQQGKESINYTLESIVTDDENNLWVGSRENGLIQISNQNENFKIRNLQFTQKRILSLLFTTGGDLYCAAENEGLFLMEKNTNNSEDYSFRKFNNRILNSNSIWSLYQDAQERIWVGTFNKGVSVYDKLQNKFNDIKSLPNSNSLKGRAVSCIVEDDPGNIWIGMDGGGIDIYNPITRQLQTINTEDDSEYDGLTCNDILGMFKDSKGNIWAGSWGSGVYFLKKGSKNFVNYTKENTNGNLTSNRIYSFSEDSKGRLWLASFDGGIIYYDAQKKIFSQCTSEQPVFKELWNIQIRTVKVDKDDNIWIGSTNGLFKAKVKKDAKDELYFDVLSYNQQMFEASQSHPSSAKIGSIYLSADSQVWVGTEGAGLFVVDEKDQVKQYKNESFKEEVIGSIVEGNNKSIWVSGANGIANIQMNSDSVITYNKEDGFLSNYFFLNSVFHANDGTIYYGNDIGLNYFKPDEIESNHVPPKLHFTSFKIFNQEITPHQKESPLSNVISKTKKITLNHNQNFFTIGFVGINFTRPEKNQYAFQLEGIDPDWRYVGNELKTTYTNIKSGDYKFKLKATNNDGVWTEQPLELEIIINPPWWHTNVAYCCYIFLILGFLFYLNKFNQYQIRGKQIVQIEREKRLQEEKLSQQKLEFFTNISHEFRTPLTLIINPLENLINTNHFMLPNEVIRKHQIIYKNSRRLNRLINELMDFRKLQFHKMSVQAEQVEVVNYVKETISYFEEEAKDRNITFEFNPNTESLVAWIDVGMIEKIIFNLLSNAFKVTPNNGKITVTINEKQIQFPHIETQELKDGFEISVKDTGGGLTQSEIGQIFQRFSQVNKVKSPYDGTGIGLELVKSFVELHKGKIEVFSKVGRGAEFKVSFILGKEHFSNEEVLNQKYNYQYSKSAKIPKVSNPIVIEKNAHSSMSVNSASEQKEYTILIVEDNMDLRNFLKFELEKEYNIILAENGKVAFDLAIAKTPHLILTDVMMPILDGIELCKKIKADLKTSHIPLLMLTAKSMVVDKLEGINSGADAFLSKPIEMELLKSTMKQLLTSRQILFDKFSKGNLHINEESPKKITALDNVFIKKMVDYIFENIDNPNLSVESIADHFFLSRSQLYRKTKSLTGITVIELMKKVRLKEANKMIQIGDGNISEISFKVGFSSPSYFAKCFKEEFGKLPTEINSKNGVQKFS